MVIRSVLLGLVVLVLSGCPQSGGEAGFHNDEGIRALGLDRYEEARRHFEAARVLNPEDAVVLGNLAVALTRLERYDEALDIYQSALTLAPNDALTVAEVAALNYRMGRYDQAEQGFRKAIELESRAPEFQSSLALALLHQGKKTEAEMALNAALPHVTKHPLIMYHQAAYLIIQGHADQGIKIFAESLKAFKGGARAAVADPDFESVYEHPAFQQLVGNWWKAIN